MYKISDYVYNLYMQQYRQIVDITMQTQDGTIHITDNDVIQGSFTIDRYCMSGKTVELGSAVAAELKLRLNNNDGRFDNVTFEGAELFVRVGIEYTAPVTWDWIKQFSWDTLRHFTWEQIRSGDIEWEDNHWKNVRREYVPCGYFTIDEPPRKLTTISLSALDRMVNFDKNFDPTLIHFPTTVSALLTKCCQICNVPLYTQANTLLNYDYVVNDPPDPENLTYRQIIQWIGEITGTCAYIDWDGKLRLEWYHDTPTVIDSAIRYTSDFYEDDITITGVQIVDTDKNRYLSGADGYVLNITGNELIQHDYQIIAVSLYNSVGGLKYRAYSCQTRSMPHIYPLDKIAYVDKNGTSHNTIITHYTFKLNGRTSISARGQTETKAGYASANPLTKREKAILAAMKRDTNKQLESRQQAVLEMNEVISNSLGLYVTPVEQENGSTIYYYHNGATLEGSNIIYTYRAGGFAWTDDWAGDDTVWQYGITKDGNAVLNMLNAYKISTDMLDAGCVTTDKLETSFIESLNGRLELVVKTTTAGAYEVNTASIVTSINDSGSSIQLSADKIYLDGLTLAAALKAGSVVTGNLQVTDSQGRSLISANTSANTLSIGGFSVFRDSSKGYITIGKTSYSDKNKGVYLGTDGIGLGRGTFHVNDAGRLHTEDADITNSLFTGILQAGTVLVSGIELGYYTNPAIEGYGMSKMASSGYREMLLLADEGMYLMKNRAGDAANGVVITDAGTYLYGYSGSTSDERAKKDIANIDDKYGAFFDRLSPRSYKYIDGSSSRTWTGLIAQEVKKALEEVGLTTQDFAGIVIPPVTAKDQNWSIRYDLFIALCINEIQKLKKIIKKRGV